MQQEKINAEKDAQTHGVFSVSMKIPQTDNGLLLIGSTVTTISSVNGEILVEVVGEYGEKITFASKDGKFDDETIKKFSLEVLFQTMKEGHDMIIEQYAYAKTSRPESIGENT